MHPAIFVTGAVSLGLLFALQEVISSRFWNYKVHMGLLLEAWGVQYLLWGVLCWLLWWKLRPQINKPAGWWMLIVLPLSIVVSIVEEMIWITVFPRLPLGRPQMPFWHRLWFHLDAELVDNMVIFWCAFFLFRGIGLLPTIPGKRSMRRRNYSPNSCKHRCALCGCS